MTLESFYFIAQIMAALGVMGSLLFVGLQIRSGTRKQLLTRTTEASENYAQFQFIPINNPEFRDIWIKGSDDIEKLSPSELLAFGAYLALWIRSIMRVTAATESWSWR